MQPQMAKTTRVSTWDRPGWGLSDGAEGKHTIATSTAALEAALATGKIGGPYVLVGHSLGGLEALLYADRHREQVAAMVLVDPSVPDQGALTERIAPALAAERVRLSPATPFRTCASDIRNGLARPGGPDPHSCFQFPPFFPPELSAALAPKVSNPIQYDTMASFIENVDESSRVAINSARNYGDMPLVVLTATARGALPPDTPPEAVQQFATYQEAFGRAHGDLAALSTRGRQVRVPGSDHYMQRSTPQVVIDTVDSVVSEARAGGR